MSPCTLILPAMKACIPACGLPSTKIALAVGVVEGHGEVGARRGGRCPSSARRSEVSMWALIVPSPKGHLGDHLVHLTLCGRGCRLPATPRGSSWPLPSTRRSGTGTSPPWNSFGCARVEGAGTLAHRLLSVVSEQLCGGRGTAGRPRDLLGGGERAHHLAADEGRPARRRRCRAGPVRWKWANQPTVAEHRVGEQARVLVADRARRRCRLDDALGVVGVDLGPGRMSSTNSRSTFSTAMRAKDWAWAAMNRTDASEPWRSRTSGSASGSIAARLGPAQAQADSAARSRKTASLVSKYQ